MSINKTSPVTRWLNNLIVAVVFAGIAAGLFFGFLFPNQRDAAIAKRTDLPIIEATVTHISGNLTVNGTPYFRIHFAYEIDGKEFTGKTNSGYTSAQANSAIEIGTINIKTDGKRTVAAEYSETPGLWVLWFITLPFGLVGVGMLITTILKGLTLTKSQPHPIHQPASTLDNNETMQSEPPFDKPQQQIQDNMYPVILTEIKRKKTEQQMYDVVSHYHGKISDETYWRLKDDIQQILNQRDKGKK